MKFTKEDARKELASQIPSKGQTLNLSERSINEQLDTLIPLVANDETELADFIKSVLPIFKTADGNVKNDVTAGIKSYQEKNPPIQSPKQEEKKSEEKKDDPMEALYKRIEELEKKNADNEKKSTLSQRRASIAAKMSEKGCKDKDWVKELLDEVNLDGDDFDEDARVEKYIKMYNKIEAKDPRDVTPKTPKGSVGDSYLKDILKAAGDKQKATLGE